ncbi:histidine kinase [Kitasatospora nipponensis]|uniref:histidine kinase n=1 Tax=Kitasatospora nipponensis TaxID=258049 RepID=A0ABN1W384_9ACTN
MSRPTPTVTPPPTPPPVPPPPAPRIAARFRRLAARPLLRRDVRPGAVTVDRVLAGTMLVAMVVERLGAGAQVRARLPVALVLSVVIAGALAVRRTAPLAAYLIGSAALSAEALFVLPSPLSPYANLIGLYALGLYATRPRARLGPVVVLLGMLAYFAGAAHTYPVIPAGVLFVWLLAWAAGYGVARRQEDREAARGLLRQRVAAEERARIARELHDLVGHTLTVMLVQAGAARRLLDREPAQSRELLGGLEHTGREALDELDRVLGLLRQGEPPTPATPGDTVAAGKPGGSGAPGAGPRGGDPDGPSGLPAPPGPQPGLADLARLTARIEQAGLRVTARIDPGTHRLPRSLDLSAYRIVQEALTNAVKHGRAGTARITVRCAGDVLDIEVRDDGRGAVDGYQPGRGLLGVAERVAMFGGSMEHGSMHHGGMEHGGPEHRGGDRGGFRLRVLLPIPR